jgi:hypothetical protein
MIVYFFFIAAAAALIALVWLRRRYGPPRDPEKDAADDALGTLYGRYWAEVRALAQTRMLDAPSGDEWLATVKAQASAAAKEPSSRPVRHSSRYAVLSWWARRLTGAATALAPLAALFYIVFSHPASNVIVAVGAMILLIFMVGVILGFIAVVSMASRAPSQHLSLPGEAPDAAERRSSGGLGLLLSRDSPLRPDDANRA